MLKEAIGNIKAFVPLRSYAA